MDEQLRPVDGRREADVSLCTEVAELVRGALGEYQAEHPISARLRLREAQRRIGTHLEGGV